MSVLAVASLIFSLLWLGGAGSLLAILLGAAALLRVRRTRQAGRGLALGGIVLGVLGLLAASGMGLIFGFAGQKAATTRRADIVLGAAGADGTTSADITYAFGDDTSQETDAPLPWRRRATRNLNGLDVLQLIVRNKGRAGTVSCRITVDGKPVKTATATGANADAACVYNAIAVRPH
ncbi:MmpS family transport accessory protein [Actinomadura gamaensis]|uniref:MmpS family transport accessory protein n=1 Tax=Actinomadura gamaensis TaxID=1763541 RepID=A0ABV9UAK6_9ACTN